MTYMTKSPSPWYWLFTLFVVFSALAIDFYSGTTTSVVIFFMATVFTPILIGAYATGLEPRDFKELLGLTGDKLLNLSMTLVGAGIITLFFFFFMKPMSTMFIGSNLYSAWFVFYLPLVRSIPLATLSPPIIALFYAWISLGEEILKLYGIKSISGALNKRGVAPFISITVAMFVSLLGWLFLHIFAWGPGFWFGLPIGFLLSFVFYGGYYITGEGLLSPDTGIQWERMCIFAPWSAHALYDIFIEYANSGIPLNPTLMLIGGSIALITGVGIAGYMYWKQGRLDDVIRDFIGFR